MKAYVDQNFLIECVQHRDALEAVLTASRSGRVSLVLSPWHFYELGNARNHSDTADILTFLESANPQWIYDRADLQLYEFLMLWKQLWESSAEQMLPITDFGNVIAAMHHVPPTRTRGLTLRQFVERFSEDDALRMIREVAHDQKGLAAANSAAYVNRLLQPHLRAAVELRHLALMMARLRTLDADLDRVEVFRVADLISSEQPLATQLQWFLKWGFVKQLKCFQTEGFFTQDLHSRGGKLSLNRFVDRQHACMALPFADAFVTRDAELLKVCAEASSRLPFKTARLVSTEVFLAELVN